MTLLLLLVPLSIVLLGAAIWAFVWAVRSGQFDDLDTPPLDMLREDTLAPALPRADTSAPANLREDSLAPALPREDTTAPANLREDTPAPASPRDASQRPG